MREQIKSCCSWLNGAMTALLVTSIAINIAIYSGKLSRQSPDAICEQVMDIVAAEHQALQFKSDVPIWDNTHPKPKKGGK